MRIRQPIVAVLGHVDSGKTSLLDKIRGTGVQGREAGGITQHIGASFLPSDTIKQMCGQLAEKLTKTEQDVPGLLVIDTPGHEVFTNLRTRGGSAADIAILVVDTNRGFQPQTNESLKILQARKVPFVVALNKVDQIPGWRPADTPYISLAIKKQDQFIQTTLDEQIYNVVGTLSILGFQSEAFYRVKDFGKEVSIVPVSARTGVGIPELLTVLVGLTQQYMQKRLEQEEKQSRGIILEVNDEVGLGTTANMILIDGKIKKGDSVVVAKRDSVIVIKPKALLLPKPLDEMRDPRDKFKPVDEVIAAAGIKIASPDLEGVLPGSTVYVTNKESQIEEFKKTIESEMKSVFIDTQTNGITLKCDTIGSLEAITEMLRRQQIPVAKADIGHVNRRDVMEAMAIKENDRHLGVILAFNVRTLPDAQEEADNHHIKIFNDQVIYSLIDNYTLWVDDDTANEENAVFSELTPICKFTFLKGYIFRNSSPAVFGIRVDAGTVKQKIQIMKSDGKKIGKIHQLQDGKKSIDTATQGQEIACSIQDVTIGRQIEEEDVFYSMPNSREAKIILEKFMHKLNPEQQTVFNEIVALLRAKDASYGYI
ncbi:MAG: translation initiation factor IF-2 [Nitrososphaeria archaeon]|nr:translation initiation factor IF-2 [Nitrososphaeria archaeon]NDB63802.1 translation initiation factor IF-2 [Nitrosopumilaceae archaeon]NDB88140.1 translation initiation factor IF-2 [Nitrososphaerota archaeon]NDB89855.1 translation initiation factor IF-2 [Nitrososphaerota archaeon]NDB91433.1 translation initiation factor IF-2 [Nitrososphaeria archaeon]